LPTHEVKPFGFPTNH